MPSQTACDNCGKLLIYNDDLIASHMIVKPIAVYAGTRSIRSKWYYCTECWGIMGGKFSEGEE